MKKFLAILCALSFALGMAACGIDPSQPADVPTEGPTDAPTEVPTDVPTEVPTDVPTEVPTETPPAGEQQGTTREMLENALVASAWAYYLKGGKMQYCSQEVTDGLNKYYGGTYRLTEDAAPEFGTSDTTIYSVCSDFVYKVYYEALGYRMFNSPNYLDAVTSAYWLFGEDVALFRWLNPNYQLTEEDIAYGVTTEKQFTTEQAREFMANWEANLRPGDVIVATGHAMLYIGNGYVVDCWGKKYNETTGLDVFEYEGSVHVLHTVEDLYLEGDDPVATGYVIKDTSDKDWFVVFRPMDAFVTEKSDQNAGQDIINMRATNSALSRMDYAGIEIDRTVNITPYGTVPVGGSLTYKIAVSNLSNDPDYVTYRKYADAAYAGVKYTGLVITERVPAGTVLVENSISHNGVFENGVITWTLDIDAGSCVELTYQVSVSASAGDTIVNDGGFVANIPSNSISNKVGGAALSETAQSGLIALGNTPVESWREQYNISALGTDLEFAERVYAKAMGIGLDLPTIQQILENIFVFEDVTVASGSIRYEGSKTAKLFALQETVSAEYQNIRDMMVEGYIGGQKLYCSTRGQTINAFSMDYLQPGDILVYASTSVYGKVYESKVMVYAGNGKLLCMDSDQTVTVITCAQENNSDLAYATIWQALKWDVFFALRPYQGCTDINTMSYDSANEPTYDQEPSRVVNALGGTTLSQEKLATLAALTAEGWTAKNINFAEAVYAAIGVDITSGTKSTSVANILKTALFFEYTGTSENFNYLPFATVASTYEQLAAMLMPELRGGPDMVGYTTNKITVGDLQPGDILTMISRRSSSYWVCVYQGNGKLLVSEYSSGASAYKTYKIYDFSQDTDGTAFSAFITQNALTNEVWECYYVLRPYQGFYDINNPSVNPNTTEDDTTIQYAPELSGFQQVSSMNSVADGHYVIAVLVNGEYKFITHEGNGYLFNPAVGTITDGAITAENLQYWCVDVIGRSEDGFTVTVANPNGYLRMNSVGSSNVSVGETADTSNTLWTLHYDPETESFALWNVSGERYLMYSTTNTAFKAYASGSETQLPSLVLYKYTGTEVTVPKEEPEEPGEVVPEGNVGTQVDSLEGVTSGQYVIVAKYGDKYYVMTQDTDGYLMSAAEIAVADGKVVVGDHLVWTVTADGSADSKTVAMSANGKYLRQTSKSSANVSFTETQVNWKLTYDAESASFRVQSSTSDRYLMFNTGNSGCFKVYAAGTNASRSSEILLFKIS